MLSSWDTCGGSAFRWRQKNEKKVYEYAARTVKKQTTGLGQAQKEQVQFMVKKVLKISSDIKEDVSDALALTICHSQLREQKLRGQKLTPSLTGESA